MPEGSSIHRRGPYLERVVFGAVAEFLSIVNKGRKALRWVRTAPNLKDFLDRIDEQLKGGQSLLTIDDDSPLDRPGRELDVLKHDRAHEVRLRVPTILHV